ncbi:hypothetical protein EVAR_10001_1 [Eumeta japonica]|uniref:Uncharacterized protein n=1 Tax=Eumeta variegata TaxID=151549 RepID=A0A4C1TR01_EUMVA|nr:hypothetical protein EVAR_10001_1 [Eumeta japonica]
MTHNPNSDNYRSAANNAVHPGVDVILALLYGVRRERVAHLHRIWPDNCLGVAATPFGSLSFYSVIGRPMVARRARAVRRLWFRRARRRMKNASDNGCGVPGVVATAGDGGGVLRVVATADDGGGGAFEFAR